MREDYLGEIWWRLWIVALYCFVFASRHKYLHLICPTTTTPPHHHHHQNYNYCPTAVVATRDTSTVDQSMPGYPPGRTLVAVAAAASTEQTVNKHWQCDILVKNNVRNVLSPLHYNRG